MKMGMALVALAALIACLARAVDEKSAKPHAAQGAVVVELFTSEGCSSCPPADKVLTDLAKAGAIEGVEVIPLAQHVDYWNRLGWTDPFSSANFSQRQEAYASSFHTDQIYTPQLVVDGTTQFVGSDRERAFASVRAAAKQPKGSITLRLSSPQANDAKLDVSVSIADLPAIIPGDVAEVFIAITENDLRTDVAAGENAGRKLSHTGVVREWKSLGNLASDRGPTFDLTAKLILKDEWHRDKLKVAAFVQERKGRRVLAATAQKFDLR